MAFKFEQLEVWNLSIDYVDAMYQIAGALPSSEQFNLSSQLRRAATSISLNIAEGSSGQTDAEQARFLGMAIRSLHETVACQLLIRRRGYGIAPQMLTQGYADADRLAAKLQAFRQAISVETVGHRNTRRQ